MAAQYTLSHKQHYAAPATAFSHIMMRTGYAYIKKMYACSMPHVRHGRNMHALKAKATLSETKDGLCKHAGRAPQIPQNNLADAILRVGLKIGF